MRFFGFLLIIAGALVAWGWPAVQAQFNNFEIGKYRVYDERVGHVPVTNLTLGANDLPISITIAGEARAVSDEAPGIAELQFDFYPTEAATSDRTAILSVPMPLLLKLEQNANAATLTAIDLPTIISLIDGQYTIETSGNAAAGIEIAFLDMTLTGRAGSTDGAYAPIGYTLMAVGALSFFINRRSKKSHRRRRDDDEDDDEDDDDDDDDDDRRRSRRRKSRSKKRRRKTSQIGRRVPQEPPKPREKEPEKPTRKWGRDGAE